VFRLVYLFLVFAEWPQGAFRMAHLRALLRLALSVATRPGKLGGRVREIVFKGITTGEVTHTTILDTAGTADYRSVIGYLAQTIMKDLRLV
jgi:hypothetical protein